MRELVDSIFSSNCKGKKWRREKSAFFGGGDVLCFREDLFELDEGRLKGMDKEVTVITQLTSTYMCS